MSYSDCYLLALYRLLGKKYSLSILELLSDEPVSFNQIQRATKNKMSPPLLSRRLKDFQDSRLLVKGISEGLTTYSLSGQGKELKNHLQGFKAWAISKGEAPAICRLPGSKCTCQLYTLPVRKESKQP